MCSNEHGVKSPLVSPSAESSARVFVGTNVNTGEQVRIPAVEICCSGYGNKGCGWIDYYPKGGAEDTLKMCNYCIKEASKERVQKAMGVLNSLFKKKP